MLAKALAAAVAILLASALTSPAETLVPSSVYAGPKRGDPAPLEGDHVGDGENSVGAIRAFDPDLLAAQLLAQRLQRADLIGDPVDLGPALGIVFDHGGAPGGRHDGAPPSSAVIYTAWTCGEVALKSEIGRRWPMTNLLDMLKEAELRIGLPQPRRGSARGFRDPAGRTLRRPRAASGRKRLYRARADRDDRGARHVRPRPSRQSLCSHPRAQRRTDRAHAVGETGGTRGAGRTQERNRPALADDQPARHAERGRAAHRLHRRLPHRHRP